MPLLVRSEPYRDFDRLFQQLMGESSRRVTSVGIPMDAYRKEDQFLLQFDVPGVDSESIELTVDNNTLTSRQNVKRPYSPKASKRWSQSVPMGFSPVRYFWATISTHRRSMRSFPTECSLWQYPLRRKRGLGESTFGTIHLKQRSWRKTNSCSGAARGFGIEPPRSISTLRAGAFLVSRQSQNPSIGKWSRKVSKPQPRDYEVEANGRTGRVTSDRSKIALFHGPAISDRSLSNSISSPHWERRGQRGIFLIGVITGGFVSAAVVSVMPPDTKTSSMPNLIVVEGPAQRVFEHALPYLRNFMNP